MSKLLKKVTFSIVGAVIVVVLNYTVIEHIIIPDPCYYHNHGTTLLFNLFYDLPAVEGFHPLPTKFNFFFTIGLGIGVGLLLARLTTPKKKRLN